MSRLTWDETGKRLYETGVERGVLYVQNDDGSYGKGVAWLGLTSVQETPDGAEANDMYADDIKYLSIRSAETFGGTIEAYTYPDEWGECDGAAEAAKGVVIGQQPRKAFGLCYRTVLGNDVKQNAYGYKLHLVWNATASPSEKQYESINDSPDGTNFSWEFTTNLVTLDGTDYKPTALITIDSTKVDADKLKELEDMLYGTESEEPKLPTPKEVIDMFKTSTSSGEQHPGA